MADSVAEERSSSTIPFDARLLAVVSEIVEGRLKPSVPAKTMTTYAVGGDIDAVVTVESVEELQKVLAVLHNDNQPTTVFGFGSNLLVSDVGLRGWVIRLGSRFRVINRLANDEVELGGAASMMSISRKLSDEGLSGLEFGAGIPGSIGGAAFMNAGAHGGEIGSRITQVSAVMPDGTIAQWNGQELPWAYRSSGLTSGCIITSIRLKLVSGDRSVISKKCLDNLSYRKVTQPLALPSAGSVFRNPSPAQPAGLILEQAGVKGLRIGGAVVSTLHANWIVNPEKSATAADILALITLCSSRVREHSGIELEPEVKLLGPLSTEVVSG